MSLRKTDHTGHGTEQSSYNVKPGDIDNDYNNVSTMNYLNAPIRNTLTIRGPNQHQNTVHGSYFGHYSKTYKPCTRGTIRSRSTAAGTFYSQITVRD